MYAHVVTDVVAHFIGIFDIWIEDARARQAIPEGEYAGSPRVQREAEIEEYGGFASRLDMRAYTPDLQHPLDFISTQPAGPHFPILSRIPAIELTPGYTLFGDVEAPFEMAQKVAVALANILPHLLLYPGADLVIAHIAQLHRMFDDDFLDLTGMSTELRDITYTFEALDELHAAALERSPFVGLERTDVPLELREMHTGIHEIVAEMRNVSLGDEAASTTLPGSQISLAADHIEGVYVNGVLVEAAPLLDDLKADALLPYDPDSADIAPVGTQIEAGGNLLANVAGVVETGIFSKVTAVMGDYYQVDAISQTFVYEDDDCVDGSFGSHNPMSTTIAMNVATFAQTSMAGPEGAGQTEDDLIFPNSWNVSVMSGDVVFLHWAYQFNFVSDSDTVTVWAEGDGISLITGDNSVLNISSFADFGSYFDLLIIGGNVYDMNIISQLSVMYDNDVVSGEGYGDVSTSGNLLFNEALIHNIGAGGPFEAMPDYMDQTIDTIEQGVDIMPLGLSADVNFAGMESLSVLYITGDLFQVNYIHQENSLGDADSVTAIAQGLDAMGGDVFVSTGSNTLVNSAQIIDYDSIAVTTYLGGNIYSDAVLIQSGLVEGEGASEGGAGSTQLVNEVIAFLDNDTIDAGNGDNSHDYGHHDATENVDVMSAVLA